MNNILLSIIIPVYNTEKELLIECLNSIKKELNTKVISQERIEIIIVNDGSSNTSTLDFLENLENIKIINQDNRGQAAAKNTGIKVAVGEYIFPLDSDDIVSDFISLYIKKITSSNEYDLVFVDLYVFGDSKYSYQLDDTLKLEYFFDGKFIPSCSIYKRFLWEKIGGYDESFITCEEYDFYCRAISNNANIQYLEKPNYYWRIINNGKSSAQINSHLFREYQNRAREKISVNKLDKKDIDDYVIKKFKKNKKRLIKLLVLTLFPSLHSFLRRIGIISSDKLL